MNKNIPAFPESGLSGLPNEEFIQGQSGMTLRQYYIAHAPAEPQPWFEPAMPPQPAHGPWRSLSGLVYMSEDAAKIGLY